MISYAKINKLFSKDKKVKCFRLSLRNKAVCKIIALIKIKLSQAWLKVQETIDKFIFKMTC